MRQGGSGGVFPLWEWSLVEGPENTSRDGK